MTFMLGGFITAAARLARGNIRPLLLPGPNEQPSTAKRLYDLGGTVLSIVILNYATAPFMLLTVKDSLTAWSRLGWYGHILIFGSLVFFYGGGTSYLKQLQKERGIAPPAKVANGPATPVNTLTAPPLEKIIPPTQK